MMKFLADVSLGPGFSGFGPLGQSGANAPTQFNDIISKIIGVMTVVSFIWFTFMVIIGAIRIVASGGDKASIESARKQITTGIIGVVIVVAAIFIVSLIGTILGIGNILNPTCIISNNC
ncbi:MAG TPA: hypothetical protein VLE44_01870 [Candidatus Saccharimonadales bacterium]|nr:hypothetical protein [Candidatus Saccharimonadales bacterium]